MKNAAKSTQNLVSKIAKVTDKQLDTAIDNLTWSRTDSCERIARNLVKLNSIADTQELATYNALVVYSARHEFDGRTLRELSARVARNASDATRKETAKAIMLVLSDAQNEELAETLKEDLQTKKAKAHAVRNIESAKSLSVPEREQRLQSQIAESRAVHQPSYRADDAIDAATLQAIVSQVVQQMIKNNTVILKKAN